MLNLMIFIEAYCYSGNTAFLKRFQELCERNDLSGGILLQDCCSKSTAFLLSWKDFKNYVNEKIFLVANYTWSLFKKHCFLDNIWPRGSQWWRYIVKKYFRESIRCFLKRFQELCERRHLSCGILVQDRCSKSTAFSTRFDQETLNGENTSSKSAQFSRKHFFRKEFLRRKTFRAIFQRSHILSRTQTKVGFPLYK
jgi:hypothetical protein